MAWQKWVAIVKSVSSKNCTKHRISFSSNSPRPNPNSSCDCTFNPSLSCGFPIHTWNADVTTMWGFPFLPSTNPSLAEQTSLLYDWPQIAFDIILKTSCFFSMYNLSEQLFGGNMKIETLHPNIPNTLKTSFDGTQGWACFLWNLNQQRVAMKSPERRQWVGDHCPPHNRKARPLCLQHGHCAWLSVEQPLETSLWKPPFVAWFLCIHLSLR